MFDMDEMLMEGFWESRWYDDGDGDFKLAPAKLNDVLDEVDAAYIKKEGITNHWYKCDIPLKDMEEWQLHNIRKWVAKNMEGPRRRKAWLEVLRKALDYKASTAFD